MKVFGFLIVFSVIIIGAHFFKLPHHYGPESVLEGELQMLKSTALGVMALFGIIFAIASTALLLPRDVEDRTLYTILCKPVPRFDYLTGKYLGVLFTLLVSLLFMDLLMVITLNFRTSSLISELTEFGESRNWSTEVLEQEISAIQVQGSTWSLQAGVFATFLKASVMAGVALLISTFSTSTLFTIILSFLVYFIGHFSGEAREFWLTQQDGITVWAKTLSHLISVFFPDLRLFNIVDSAVAGTKVSAFAVLQLTGITLIYSALYLVGSWITFAKKEF